MTNDTSGERGQVGFTKANWQVNRSGTGVNIGDSIKLRQVTGPMAACCAVQQRAYEELLANAKLIAAAPEMLEVLRKFMDFKDQDYVPNGLFDRAKAAIKKATGE